MYIDSHAHYDDKRFDKDRDHLLGALLPEAGVDIVVNAGASLASSKKGIELAKKYDYIYAAVGVHPHDADTLNEDVLAELKALCEEEKVVAFGEIGLDFYYDNSPRDLQKLWFERQLQAAKEVGLPVIIHSRDAAKLTMDIIKDANLPKGGERGPGVIHCYSGGVEMALEYAEMGFYIGIGGVITFQNAKKLVEVVEQLPMEKLLLETDCPYLSPVPRRGERNTSINLSYVAEKIGEIKKIAPGEVAKITASNARDLFILK